MHHKTPSSVYAKPEVLNIPKYTQINDGIMEATTIKIHEDTKHQLDRFREYRNESYDEVIRKVVYIARACEKEPELSKATIMAIEEARERMRKGRFVTEAEAKKRLGL